MMEMSREVENELIWLMTEIGCLIKENGECDENEEIINLGEEIIEGEYRGDEFKEKMEGFLKSGRYELDLIDEYYKEYVKRIG